LHNEVLIRYFRSRSIRRPIKHSKVMN